MKTSHIVILIVMAAMMVLVLMAGCKEKTEESNEPAEPTNVIIIDLTDPNMKVILSIINKETGEWEIMASGNWGSVWEKAQAKENNHY